MSDLDHEAIIEAANFLKRESYQHWLRVRDTLEDKKEYSDNLVQLHYMLSWLVMEVICEKY